MNDEANLDDVEVDEGKDDAKPEGKGAGTNDDADLDEEDGDDDFLEKEEGDEL